MTTAKFVYNSIMKLIVGLGNPGEKYEKTRHNLGFAVVDQFFKDFEPIGKTTWTDEKKFKSDIATIEWKPKVGPLEKVVLAKPKTYMNNSGMAVALITSYYKLFPSDIWIVHDDIDLGLGALRIRFGGGTAGHRGVTSVMEQLTTEKFWRFRLGIGYSRRHHGNGKHKLYMRDVDEFVLKGFSHSERGKTKDLIKHAAKSIACALEQSLEVAMNKFNTK